MKLSRGARGCYTLLEPRILLGNFRTLQETALCTTQGHSPHHSLHEVSLPLELRRAQPCFTGPDGEHPSIHPSNNISEQLIFARFYDRLWFFENHKAKIPRKGVGSFGPKKCIWFVKPTFPISPMRTLRSSEAIYMLTMTKLENGSTGSVLRPPPMLPFTGPLTFTISLSFRKDPNHRSLSWESKCRHPEGNLDMLSSSTLGHSEMFLENRYIPIPASHSWL